jgi:TetR/AcrR family transcriptional regulator
MTPASAGIRYPIDERAERIISAGLDEFARRGFAGARESVIARRAGVSTATLKRYFPTRDELFREVVRSTIVSEPPVEDPSAPVPAESATSRLQAFVRRFWTSMERPGQAAMLRISIGELPRFPELAIFHATEVLGRAARALERTLHDGAARGEFRSTDTRAAARVILSALVTHAHWFAYPGVYAGIIGTDRDGAKNAVIGLVVNALRPVPSH